MKKVFLILLLLNAINVFSQNYFSVINKFNWATQLNIDPTKPEDGTFQWAWLPSYGVGIAYQRDIFKNTAVRLGTNYVRKGCQEDSQFEFFGLSDTYQERTLKNYFDYIGVDILLKRYLSKPRFLRPYAYAGGRADYLLKTKMASLIWPQTLSEPYKSYNNFNKLSGGWLFGLGTEINQVLFLEFEVNKDLTKVINIERLVVKNWVWSLNLGININELCKSKKITN